jgi:hypothetical protein
LEVSEVISSGLLKVVLLPLCKYDDAKEPLGCHSSSVDLVKELLKVHSTLLSASNDGSSHLALLLAVAQYSSA